jgi:hypothetical protein
MAAPVVSTRKLAKIPQYDLYREMIGVDEFSDNDGDTALEMGTSVRAGAKVFQKHGFLDTYGWAFDIEPAVAWLQEHGPLVAGISWYTGFDDPDPQGFIKKTGSDEGGHCVCLLGWNQTRGAIYGINSWGPTWGPLRGRFWISGEDFEKLLAEGGECCTSLEVVASSQPLGSID